MQAKRRLEEELKQLDKVGVAGIDETIFHKSLTAVDEMLSKSSSRIIAKNIPFEEGQPRGNSTEREGNCTDFRIVITDVESNQKLNEKG